MIIKAKNFKGFTAGELIDYLKKIPKKIIKTRLSHGGRVSAIPYAVGGKVYSQAIRKPKLI